MFFKLSCMLSNMFKQIPKRYMQMDKKSQMIKSSTRTYTRRQGVEVKIRKRHVWLSWWQIHKIKLLVYFKSSFNINTLSLKSRLVNWKRLTFNNFLVDDKKLQRSKIESTTDLSLGKSVVGSKEYCERHYHVNYTRQRD